METTRTDLPLHEVVLEIMFNGNDEKAVPFTSEDILWKIDNPEISQRNIREVLDWLVQKRRVNCHMGKYTLDRFEFLDLKKKKNSLDTLETPITRTTKQKPPSKVLNIKKPRQERKKKTFFINKPLVTSKKETSFFKICFFIGILSTLVVSYFYYDLRQENAFNEDNTELLTIVAPKIEVQSMYISKKSESTEEKFRDINYSFSRENSNTKKLKSKINSLYKITDSLQKENTALILDLHASINNNIEKSNTTYKTLIISNTLFLILFLMLYFRKR